MKKKERKIVLKSKSWNPVKKSDRAAYQELTVLLHQFSVIATDHFFRAGTRKERETVVSLVRFHANAYFQDVDDGSGALDCGPLCPDGSGGCRLCAWHYT